MTAGAHAEDSDEEPAVGHPDVPAEEPAAHVDGGPAVVHDAGAGPAADPDRPRANRRKTGVAYRPV
jgi:hypothetical protein